MNHSDPSAAEAIIRSVFRQAPPGSAEACLALLVEVVDYLSSHSSETMRNFIHVRHLVQLSAVDAGYQVDPVADLRPVCPNCHAVIHSQDLPRGIREARRLLSAHLSAVKLAAATD